MFAALATIASSTFLNNVVIYLANTWTWGG